MLPVPTSAWCCRGVGCNPSQDDLLWQLRDPSSGAAKARRTLGSDSNGVLLVLLSLERDALKACRHVDDQVLSIMRINAQLKLVMRPTTVPLGR